MPKGKPNKALSTEVPSIAKIVKAKGSLAEIEKLCSEGVAIDSKELSLKALKAYVQPLAGETHYKLLNTIELFERLANKQSITEQITKSHYKKVFNQKGNCLVHELIAQGLEEECITLLKRYDTSKVEALQMLKSIWHLAVRNNLQQVVRYLTLEDRKNIDCLDEHKVTPWALAVCLNNAELAQLLKQRGANTSIQLNEQGQTLLHMAVIEEDIELLKKCIKCKVESDVVDAKGYTAHYYAHRNKNEAIIEILKESKRQMENANSIDLHNSVKKDDSEALQVILNAGADPKKFKSTTLLDLAIIYKSKEVQTILRAADVGRNKTDQEIQEIRRKNFSKKPNPLLATYAMAKLSLKKSEFRISWWHLLFVCLVSVLFSLIASSVLLSIVCGVASGLLYVGTLGILHLKKLKVEKNLKDIYKKKLDEKRSSLLKLAEQIDPVKHAELLTELTEDYTRKSEPTFEKTEDGSVYITQSKLLLIDKQIERLRKVEIEVPDSARAKNRAKI